MLDEFTGLPQRRRIDEEMADEAQFTGPYLLCQIRAQERRLVRRVLAWLPLRRRRDVAVDLASVAVVHSGPFQ